jgi:hypothetical protein
MSNFGLRDLHLQLYTRQTREVLREPVGAFEQKDTVVTERLS